MPDDVLSEAPKAPKAPKDPKEPKLRSFGDVKATRDTLFENVQRSLEEKFPLSNERYTLRIAGTKYSKPKKFSNGEQKRALMRGQTLGWNLTGKWELVDNKSGKIVDKTNNRLIAQVPYITDRGTFIFNGNEYTVASQMRLRPGVYSRVKDNGIIEAHFNVKGGTGRSFRVYMEPETGVFRVNVGQANLKLYPLLRAMGVEDRNLNEMWGADLLQANVAAADPRAVQRAYTKMVGNRADQIPEKERDTDAVKTAANKLPKFDVNYVMLGTLQTCSQCVHFEGGNSCSRVQGWISDIGWCVLWNPTFGKHAQEYSGNRRRARFVGELVCDDAKDGKEWAYLKVHKGLPEAAFASLQDQGVDCEGRFDLPHISVLRTWEVKDLKAKYGKKWKKICGEGRRIPFSLQNAMVDLDPEGWEDMDRVWFLEAKSPELRAHRKSLGFEDLPRGDDSGEPLQFHITIAVRPVKRGRGDSKISAVFDEVEAHTKAAFEALQGAIEEATSDTLVKSAMATKLAEILDMSSPTEEIEENEEPADLIERQQLAIRDLRGNPAAEKVKIKQDIHTLKKDQTTKERYIGLEELKAMLPMSVLKTAYQLFVGRERFYDEQMTKQASENRQYGAGLRAVFEAMELDPTTTEMTLGKAVTNVSPELIVDVTKRLINISRREAETDDRDSLAFQRVYGPEDLFAERISRDAGGLARKLLWKATTKGAVKNFPSGALSPQLRMVLLKSGLGAPLEEVNPLEIFDQQVRVTRMGEGGMPSLDSVPDEARSVQPSHFGVIDPIRAPEGMKIGVDSRVTHRTYKGSDGSIYADMLDVKKGKPTRISAETMSKSVIAFPGEMATKSKEVRAMIKGKRLAYVDRKEVDYELPHTSHMFTATSNMVPLVSAIKGGRLLMGAKMATQALPLRNTEAPLVQNLYDDGSGKSFEEIYGERVGAIRADGIGRVTDISRDGVTVKYTDGRKEEYDLYNNFPFNRKSVVGDTTIYVKRKTGELWVGGIARYEYASEDLTLTIDPETKLSTWLPITGLIRHENDKRLLKVTLKSGRSFTITEDHSLTVMGSDGNLKAAYPDQCVSGSTCLPVAMAPLSGESDVLTVDEALLGGLYLAEGYTPDSQPNLINIAVAPDDRAKQVIELMQRLGLKPYRNGGSVCANDARIAVLMKRHFGHLSHAKFISEAVMTSSPAVRAAVVSGYFGGDGCLHSDSNGAIQLYAFSVSKRLRDDIALVLASFGIFTTFSERPNEEKSPNWRRAYGLRVISSHIYKLDRWMFYEDREKLLCELLDVRVPRSSPYETLPIPHAARATLYAGFRDSGLKVPHFVYKTACGGHVAKHRVADIPGVFGDWGRSDVCWDFIESIEEASHEAFVYDLSVERAESFAVAGGVVVHNTYLHNTPMVKIGDPVSPGTLIAKSNFTDDAGSVAIGLNLRVGYMPYRGYNSDDAIVLSEAAAKKLSSEHMYTTKYKESENYETGKNSFLSLFPGTFNKLQMKTISPKGVIRPGTKVEYGDPLVLAVAKRKPTGGGMIRTRKDLYSDVSETWEHESPGVVTDVDKTKDGYKVSVKAYSPMHIGDKLSNRFGGKGVVSKILPDDKMPHSAAGEPLELLLNPLGIVSRTNPAQIVEVVLGKVAKKTGHTYKLPGFSDENYIDYAQRELGKHGLSDTEDIYDPTSGRKIPRVLTGHTYMMKLHHMAEPKSSGRDIGSYTSEGIPAGGGQEGCFPAAQNIKTLLGEQSIAHIVEKRLHALVWTYDAVRGDWVFRPVTDWFTRRVDVSDILRIELAGIPADTGVKSRKWASCLYPTKNHAIYTADGRCVAAGDLTIRDKLVTWGPIPTADQCDLLFGTMLGDSHLNVHVLECEHSAKQSYYASWKSAVLAGLNPKLKTATRAAPKKMRTTGRETMRTTKMRVSWGHVLSMLSDVCLTDGRKAVTLNWLDHVGELGIAVWLLDDGSITNRSKKKGGRKLSGNIATQGFSGVERQLLAAWLSSKLQLTKALSVNRNGAVSLTVEACEQLIELIARNVPSAVIPHSKRFLIAEVSKIQDKCPPRKLDTVCHLGRISSEIRSIRPYKHDKPEVTTISVYDITVDGTHAYTVGGALVSNSKRIGMGEMTALISHGATEVIRDAKLVRGQRNDDFWRALRLGYTPPSPKVPMIYEKFISYLQGSGINLKKQGETTHLMAMTDKDTTKMSAGAITKAETITANTLNPIKGGLFDVGLTGGHGGTRWTHIDLAEPMPNPVMEEPLRRLLELTKPRMMKIINGEESLNGESGPKALLSALKRIRLDSAIERYSSEMTDMTGAKRDNAVKVLGYLRAMKKNGQKPEDLMVTKVPVLPPNFRPITSFNKMTMISDPNYLYLDMMKANDDLTDLKKAVGEEGVGEERANLYKAYKAVTGLGDPVGIKSQDKRVRGMLAHVFGGSPKFGMYQRRVLGAAVDTVGRGVITPNPSLGMDQVGLPEDKAWVLFRPFIVRNLVRRGLGAMESAHHIENESDVARKALVEEMAKRPVLINRAPVLHRYGMMASWAIPVKGDTLQVPPITTSGFNADFDGDAMNYHVPVSKAAVDEAVNKMMPSRNLLSVSDFDVHYFPRQEFLHGLHLASTSKKKGRAKVFMKKEDVIKAYKRGELSIDDIVQMSNK